MTQASLCSWISSRFRCKQGLGVFMGCSSCRAGFRFCWASLRTWQRLRKWHRANRSCSHRWRKASVLERVFFLLTRIRGMGGVGETIQMSVTEMKPHLFRSLQSRVTLLNSDSWRCRLNMLPSKWNHFNLFYYFIIFKWPHLIYSMLLLNFKKVLFQSHYNYYLHLQYKGVYCSMAAEKASNTWFWGQLWHLHMMYSMWPLKSSFKCFKWLSLHCTTTLIEFLTF